VIEHFGTCCPRPAFRERVRHERPVGQDPRAVHGLRPASPPAPKGSSLRRDALTALTYRTSEFGCCQNCCQAHDGVRRWHKMSYAGIRKTTISSVDDEKRTVPE
jgi:hypothetical protein